MTLEQQDTTLEEAELAWHQQQLREGWLTYQEREYHRDMISWLEQQRAARGKQPQLLGQHKVGFSSRSQGARRHRWLPALLTWLQ